MAKIPTALHDAINGAYPDNVCLVGVLVDDGFTQISPRGSIVVYDDETLGFWDRAAAALTTASPTAPR
jgi:hypothetical protein